MATARHHPLAASTRLLQHGRIAYSAYSIVVVRFDVEHVEHDETVLEIPVAPLTSEQREARLRELEDWGVDLGLIRTALARTPTQRLLHLQDLSDSIKQMQKAWQRQRGSRVPHAQQMTVDTSSDMSQP